MRPIPGLISCAGMAERDGDCMSDSTQRREEKRFCNITFNDCNYYSQAHNKLHAPRMPG